jgi:hypothetical protein
MFPDFDFDPVQLRQRAMVRIPLWPAGTMRKRVGTSSIAALLQTSSPKSPWVSIATVTSAKPFRRTLPG